MRAPPESLWPITVAPARIAKSMILQIFSALDSESDPPNTVKSCAKTYTKRPSMRPKPVTKPSPAGRCSCIPKSTQRCRTNLSSSSKLPSSRRRWMRSRAVSLPALCSRSRRSGPPPASASSEMRRSSCIRSRCLASGIKLGFGSDNGSSLGRGILWGKDAHRKMRGNPSGSEKQHDAEEQFRAHGGGALQRRLERSHILRSLHQNKHGPEGQSHDENGSQNGSEDHFHRTGIGPPGSGMKKDSATGRKAERRRRSVSGRAISANRTSRQRLELNHWDSKRRTLCWRAGRPRGAPGELDFR